VLLIGVLALMLFWILPPQAWLFAQDAETTTEPPESLLEWLLRSLGWLYVTVFLLLSLIFVALLIMNIIVARRSHICPQHLIDGFEAHLDEKRYQEAYELAKNDESFLGNVLAAGLARLSSSYKAATEAMQETGESEALRMDHRLSYLALIGTISPMVGLFGTVDGMIRSFFEIATAGATPNAQKLADGISTALLTTYIGLAIAIPAIIAFNVLRNWIQRLILEVGVTSDNLMSRFEKVGTKTEKEKP
jgi:biopolymer transport protein ExbB